MKTLTLLTLLGLLLVCPMVQAQFLGTGSTTMSVTVLPEAALSVTTSTTTLISAGLFAPYTGTTNLLYKIRTLKSTGTGNIQLEVTTDFGPAGGPSVGAPPTGTDTLDYTCTAAAPGVPCVGTITAKLGTLPAQLTSVATFGGTASSALAGNAASTSWTLTDDPLYATGAYSATVTYTISAA